MKNHYTAVIVGGGPAGSSAAHTLAKSGVDVCVVDRFLFPRPKLCGGLLTQRAKKNYAEIFGPGWDELHEYRCAGAKFFDGERLVNAIENYGELYVCDRYRFDARLIDKAKSSGAELLHGDRVTAVDTRNCVCKLRSGKEIAYRYLIGADGVNSVVANAIHNGKTSRNGKAFALEVVFPVSDLSRKVAEPEIYLSSIE